jgi:hypothetical protein
MNTTLPGPCLPRGLLPDPEIWLVTGSETDGYLEVHESADAQWGQHGIVEGGARGHVSALDCDVIKHAAILT